MPFRLLKQDERNFYSVHISAFFFCVEELFGQAASTHPTNGSTRVGLPRVGLPRVQAHSVWCKAVFVHSKTGYFFMCRLALTQVQ